MSGGPGCLEIEPPSDAVDIKRFACEVELGLEFAFKTLEIDFLQINSAAGDEFFFIHALARYLETTGDTGFCESLKVGVGELRVLRTWGDFSVLDKAFPKASRN